MDRQEVVFIDELLEMRRQNSFSIYTAFHAGLTHFRVKS